MLTESTDLILCCGVFMGAMPVSYSQTSISQPPSYPVARTFFLPLFLYVPEAWGGKADIEVPPLRAEHSIDMYSQSFDSYNLHQLLFPAEGSLSGSVLLIV